MHKQDSIQLDLQNSFVIYQLISYSFSHPIPPDSKAKTDQGRWNQDSEHIPKKLLAPSGSQPWG